MGIRTLRKAIKHPHGPEPQPSHRPPGARREPAFPPVAGTGPVAYARRAGRVPPLAWIAALAAAWAVGLSVAAHRMPYFAADLALTRAVQATDFGVLAAPMHALNVIGFPPLVGLIYGGVIVAIFLAGARWEAIACGFNVLGSSGINQLVKTLVDRPRPSDDLVHIEHHITSAAFPAGHVLNFTAFAGFLCCLAWMRMTPSWPRAALVAVLGASILLMGVARIAAGEHWPSDVLAGYLMGGAWLAVTVAFYRRGHDRFAFARPLRAHHTVAAVPREREDEPAADDRARAGGPLRFAGLDLALLPFALPLLALAAFARPATSAPEAPAEPAAATEADSLGTTWQTPWNPDHVLPRRQAWEQVVLLPGRIVSLPLSGLGYVTDQTFGYLEQSGKMPIGPVTPGTRVSRPIVFGLPQLGDRTGFGGSVAARAQLPQPVYSRLSVAYSASNTFYNRTLATWSGRPLALQYGYEWRPEDRYYGAGTSSSKDSVSDYAMQSEFVRGSARWAWGRDPATVRPRMVFGAWAGPRSIVTRTGREHHQYSYDERFPGYAAQTLDRRVEHFIYGASWLADYRAGAPHWSRGWRLLASAEQFGAPVQTLALHTATDDGATFQRYQLEGETGVSFWRDPRTLRVSVHVTDQQVTQRRDRFLVSDLATLGGLPGLAGYLPGRFHDLDMLLTRVNYVFPLARRFEMDLHSEWGAVYPDVWNDARLSSLHNSFGFALRSRSDRAPRGAIGLDFSRENVRLRYTLGGVE